MDLSAATTLARSLMNEHGLVDWLFELGHAKKQLGLCTYHRGWLHHFQVTGEVRAGKWVGRCKIRLSRYFVLNHTEADVRDIILHEIAHALTAGDHHGPLFRAKCRELGCHAACKRKADMPKGKWLAVCPCCGAKFRKHRKPSDRYSRWCGACGPKGALDYRKCA